VIGAAAEQVELPDVVLLNRRKKGRIIPPFASPRGVRLSDV
jgi:hypothetical protein